eukprot:32199-Pelagomonas_calceolata.AAC.1
MVRKHSFQICPCNAPRTVSPIVRLISLWLVHASQQQIQKLRHEKEKLLVVLQEIRLDYTGDLQPDCSADHHNLCLKSSVKSCSEIGVPCFIADTKDSQRRNP